MIDPSGFDDIACVFHLEVSHEIARFGNFT
jgi:hypothetical protein